MAGEIDMSNGRANVAFVGEIPWHGLGQQLTRGAPIPVWKKEAGLDWKVLTAPVEYTDKNGKGHCVNERQVLYRSDTGDHLGIVSDTYRIVQPEAILSFYEDLVEQYGFVLNTAGSLKDGRVIWALAETGESFTLGRKDKVNGFLLLSTSNDKTMATRVQHTSIRVVCNNTLNIARSQNSPGSLSISHSSRFDAVAVKEQLGIYKSNWSEFQDLSKELSKYKMADEDALEFLAKILMRSKKDLEQTMETRTVKNVFELYKGKGKGADLVSASNTAWGLLNSVTEFFDHHRGSNPNSRLVNSWFKNGARLKQKAWEEAVQLVA